MDEPDANPAIACNLDALSPSERARRSELARAIQHSAMGVDESESGYRVHLPNDSESADLIRWCLEGCRSALERRQSRSRPQDLQRIPDLEALRDPGGEG